MLTGAFLTGLFCGAVAIGLLVGRLYSFVGVLIVSPLVWLVAAVALWPARPLWATLAGSTAILLALHLGFLAGAAGRLRSERKALMKTPRRGNIPSRRVGPRSIG